MDWTNLLKNVENFSRNLTINLKDFESDVLPHESRDFNPVLRKIYMPGFNWKGHKANLYFGNSFIADKIGKIRLMSGFSKYQNDPLCYEIIDAKFNCDLNFKDGTYIAKGERIKSVNVFGDFFQENLYLSEAAQRIPLEEWINGENIKQTNTSFPDGFARLVSDCLEYRDKESI